MQKLKPVVGQYYKLVNPHASDMHSIFRNCQCKVIENDPEDVSLYYVILGSEDAGIDDIWGCARSEFHKAFKLWSTVNVLGNFPKKVVKKHGQI